MQVRLKVLLVVIVSLIVVVASYSILTSTIQIPEASLWMFQSTFYAFMTALFGFISGVLVLLVRDYLEGRKIKKIEKKKALESLRVEYNRCASSIKDNIEKFIKNNENAHLEAILSETWVFGEKPRIFEELRKQVQEFNEKCKDFNMFCKISEPMIRYTIEKTVKRMFPKTTKKSDEFYTMLCLDFLMTEYMNGERVTSNWLREKHPIALKNIIKEIDETERNECDVLFGELNNEFEKNDVLQRFRKEKKELIKKGEEILQDLEREINSVNEELKKYSSLDIGVVGPIPHPR